MFESGRAVSFHCAGMLADGYVFLDTWTSGEPMRAVIGDGSLIPGLDRKLRELHRGQRCRFAVPSCDVYGDYDESLVFSVPSASIPNYSELPVGRYIMMNIDGDAVRLKVLSVDDCQVRFDANHELSGRDLTFEVEIVSDGAQTAVDQEIDSKGCGCGALRESLRGGACCEGHDGGHVHGGGHEREGCVGA